jgi:hypothetical protein
MREDAMTYEAPALLDLGPVEARTFGGTRWPVHFDHTTGYTGHIIPPGPVDIEAAE